MAAKAVVAPEVAVTQPPAPSPAAPAEPPKKVVTFWKVMNPFEKIVFKDGTDLVFGRTSFSTADEQLIQKINEVAQRYGILVQNGETV